MLLFCFRFLGLGVNTQNPGGLTIVNTNSYKINGVPSPVKGKIMLLVWRHRVCVCVCVREREREREREG